MIVIKDGLVTEEVLVEDVLRKDTLLVGHPHWYKNMLPIRKILETETNRKLYKKRGDWCYWRNTTRIRVFSINLTRLLYLNHSKGE